MHSGSILPTAAVAAGKRGLHSRHPPRQKPHAQRPPWTEIPWTETPVDRDPPVQSPAPDRDPPCGQTDTCENITFGKQKMTA